MESLITLLLALIALCALVGLFCKLIFKWTWKQYFKYLFGYFF